MMPDPEEFAREWIASWNAHDLDRVLSHYSEDFEMSSPYIMQFTGGRTGTIRGKEQVRAYWSRALERTPDLQFKHVKTYVGANSVAIHYHGARGKTAVEVLVFGPDGLVQRAAAHYD